MATASSSGGGTLPRGARPLQAVALVAVIGAIAVAGCGGGSSSHAAKPAPSMGSPSSTGASSSKASAPPASAIPQHGGGDHDADNSGGPSDGDGAI